MTQSHSKLSSMQTLETKYATCDILLVDDDIDEHFLIECSLGEMGLNKKLLSFDSGVKALQYLKMLPKPDFPSLIVLDYNMPLMNGKDVLQHLKNTHRYSNIPVIIHSSEMNQNMKCDLLELGATACFRKTFDMRELKIYLAALAVIFDNEVYK